MKVVQEELEVEVTATHFWTDSKICLAWLCTKEKLNAYVGSRIGKIKDNGHNKTMWTWIPSLLNVADLATKSSKFANIRECLDGRSMTKASGRIKTALRCQRLNL